MRYRVWQWGIEIRLGSHYQTKLSSSFAKTGFDSKVEALEWAAKQDKTEWGIWSVCQMGESCVVICDYKDLPTSYKAALAVSVV